MEGNISGSLPLHRWNPSSADWHPHQAVSASGGSVWCALTGKALPTMTLVKGRSFSLESLDITCHIPCTSARHLHLHHPLLPVEPKPVLINLSRATKLIEVVFRIESQRFEWVTTALKTITSQHRNFRQVSLEILDDLTLARPDADVGETVYRQWLDPDHLLVQLWGSHSRPATGKTLTLNTSRYDISSVFFSFTKDRSF